MNLKDLEKPFSIALVVAVLGLSFMIVKPFVIAILWGGLIAFATWPVHTWISAKIKSTIGSATLLALIMIALIIVPLVVVGIGIAGDGKDVIQPLIQMTKTALPDLPSWVGSIPVVGQSVLSYWMTWQSKGVDWFADAVPYLQASARYLFAHSGALGSVLGQLGLAILFAFWFYVQGQQIAGALQSILGRIIGASHSHYWKVAADTVQNVINGIIGTALAQGVVAAIGFWIAGVPAPLLLGALTFIAGVIPFAPPLIWIPATVWLFLNGESGYAIFMGLWGFIVISGVDNVLKPLLISRGSVMPIAIVLLGVLGGMVAFGFLGLFVGPVMLALTYTLIREWLNTQAPPSPSAAP